MSELFERHLDRQVQGQHIFLVAGNVAGTCLGATQSAGRTLVGLFAPGGKAGEIFGFWGMSLKLAAIVGILGLGLLQVLLGCGRRFCSASSCSPPLSSPPGG